MRRQSKLHAKEQLEKEKLGEKKVAVDPPRKKRRVWKFPSQMKEDIRKRKLAYRFTCTEPAESPAYQWPAMYFAFREQCVLLMHNSMRPFRFIL